MRLFFQSFITFSAIFILLSGTVLGNEGSSSEICSNPIEPTPFVLQFLAKSKGFNDKNIQKLATAGAVLKTSLVEDKPEASVSAQFALKNSHGVLEITSDIDHTEVYNSLSDEQIQSLKDYAQSAQEFQKDAYTLCNYTGTFCLDEKNRTAKAVVTSKCSTAMDYAMLMSLMTAHPHYK